VADFGSRQGQAGFCRHCDEGDGGDSLLYVTEQFPGLKEVDNRGDTTRQHDDV